jgi:hypothetical protein
MKKVFLLATAALLVTGVTFADNGKKKKSTKGKPAPVKLKQERNPAAKKKLKQRKFNYYVVLNKKPSRYEKVFYL